MIYLAIDTDVWLWLIIHGIDVEENYFDELCYWLENGFVRCIVPDNIIDEWERNKDAKIAAIKADLRKATFLDKSVIQRPEFLNSVYNADNFEELAKLRVNKVAEIFEKYADIAEVSDAIKIQAGNRTLAKLAPSHGKNSYADAVNILAVLTLIREKALAPVIFTSKNKSDFSDPANDTKVHSDLSPLFDEVNLEYFHDTNHLFHKRLKTQLPSFKKFLAVKQQAEQREKLHSDQQEREKLSNPDQDFITNTQTVNQILEQNRPTAFQFKMIHDLIENDESCRKYFFEKVSKPAWFSFLAEKGYLDPATHPGPVESPQGTYLSHWAPLGYLERLAKQVDTGENTEMTQPLIAVIKKVSEAKIDNDLTSTTLIRILSNLPNQAIGLDILSFIPIWFSEQTNKMFPTTAVCTYLLPKFINDTATGVDIQKGEYILNYLLGVSKKGVEIDNTPEKIDTSYFPNAYPPMLLDALVKKDLLKNIARLCSPEVFYNFSRNLKLVILDYPNGLHMSLIQGAATFEVKIVVGASDLAFSLTLPDGNEKFSEAIIKDYGQLEKNELRKAILQVVATLGLTYEPLPENQDRLKGLLFALTVDRLSVAGAVPIADMDERTASSKHFRVGYGILLTRYLAAITETEPTLGTTIAQVLFNDHHYRLPFFRRMVLHNIATHFESQRKLFSELLGPDDPWRLFDDYTYRPDLFNLLKHNQQLFSQAEIDLLIGIINAGPPDAKDEDEEKKSYWRFRWYLALNQLSPFKEQYKLVGETHKLRDRDVDPTQTMRFRSGTIPPMTMDQLLEMDTQALVNYLLAFNPKDRWEEPNIDGLGSILQKAVIANPGKFLPYLNLFLPVPYIFIYHLLYGLLEAGRKTPKDFDWCAVTNFCYQYVHQNDFTAQKRTLKADGWKADKHWVMGVVAYHISEVSKQDDYVKEHDLLKVCRETLLLMYSYFIVGEEEEPQHKDYISYSLNSDNGKLLRACLDYCLCKARVKNVKQPELEQEFLNIFDISLEKKAMDAYILLGYYWQQFNYLNREWLPLKIKALKLATPANWKAFMGGFLFSPAPSNKKTLALVIPYYRRAIKENLEIKVTGTNGLASHLTALYFWGMLDLSENGIIKTYVTEMPATSIAALLHSIFFNEKYFETLKPADRQQLENRVIDLIEFIHHHFADHDDAEYQGIKRSTVNIIYLINQLNERNTQIIKTGILLGKKQYHHHDLFDRLVILMNVGEPGSTAKYLAEILEAMTFPDHVHLMEDDQESLSLLIQFLYDHQQSQSANTLCNRLSKAGQSFAQELYLKNNK